MDFRISLDNPLFVLAVLLTAGGVCGHLARRLHLPSVTGQILAGVLLGPAVLGVFGAEAAHPLSPIVHFALGLIAVDIGTHLHLRRLRNHFRRLGLLLLLEATATPLFVYGALVFGARTDWTIGILFGTLAVATAPATVLAIVKETRSRGVYVRTLIAAVALNNIACITAVRDGVHGGRAAERFDPGGGAEGRVFLMRPLIQVAVCGDLLGGGVGLAMVLLHPPRVPLPTGWPRPSSGGISLFLTVGHVGHDRWVFRACWLVPLPGRGDPGQHWCRRRKRWGTGRSPASSPPSWPIFFTLAGLELDFSRHAVRRLGLLVAPFVVLARAGGKVLAGYLSMSIARRAAVHVRQLHGLGAAARRPAWPWVCCCKVREERTGRHRWASSFLVVGVATVACSTRSSAR